MIVITANGWHRSCFGPQQDLAVKPPPSAVTSERVHASAAIGTKRAYHTPWGAVLEGNEVDSASVAPPAHFAASVIAERIWGLDVAVVSDGFGAGPLDKGCAACSCGKDGRAMLSSCQCMAECAIRKGGNMWPLPSNHDWAWTDPVSTGRILSNREFL